MDIFNKKEVARLNNIIENDNKTISELRCNISNLAAINNKLEKALGKDYENVLNCQDKIDELNCKIHQLESDFEKNKADFEEKTKELENNYNKKVEEIDNETDTLTTTKNILQTDIKNLENTLINLKEEELYQSFGLYTPIYDFANSEQYKNKLETIRQEQKNMIKTDKAVSLNKETNSDYTVQVINNVIKLSLRSFNNECEMIVDKVKFNNMDAMRSKILKSYEQLNKLTSKFGIAITIKYLNLKLDELSLSYEYQLKKQEEKEQQKIIREELREQAKVEKELEDARKNTIKDKQHYEKAINDIERRLENIFDDEEKQNLVAKKGLLEVELDNINSKLADIDYRQQNQKAGYVYIISNIGSFGENIYKIGMTRRLEPEERIHELSDASVPFNFDIHALIFTEDAPALENALHKAFDDKKVNMVNQRREFFNVTLNEIKKVIKNNFDKSVEFVDIPPAEQYRETQRIINQ